MGREAFAIVDGIRQARLGARLGTAGPLFWPAEAPTCKVCGTPVEYEQAHQLDEDGRLVQVHRDCCPFCPSVA